MSAGTSRREFIGAVAMSPALRLVAGAKALGPRAEAVTTPALKLGIASYSFRQFPLERALAMAKTLGVSRMTFNPVHMPPTDPPEATRALRARIEAAGITITGGGTLRIAADPAHIEQTFEYAKNAGFPLIYTDPDPGALDAIERLARSYDIRVAIHNHGPEDKRWPRPQDAYAAVRARDRRLGLCIDIGHTFRTGTDPVQACRECRDRLYDMHVKDLAARGEKESQVEVGRGLIDFPALFRTLIEIGYQGQVGLEYEINPNDPLPGMIESMAYMRGVLAAVAPRGG